MSVSLSKSSFKSSNITAVTVNQEELGKSSLGYTES